MDELSPCEQNIRFHATGNLDNRHVGLLCAASAHAMSACFTDRLTPPTSLGLLASHGCQDARSCFACLPLALLRNGHVGGGSRRSGLRLFCTRCSRNLGRGPAKPALKCSKNLAGVTHVTTQLLGLSVIADQSALVAVVMALLISPIIS